MDLCDFGLKIIAVKKLGWIYVYTVLLYLIRNWKFAPFLTNCRNAAHMMLAATGEWTE